MSYFATSDAKPEWVDGLPDGWTSNWLKWAASLSTERPNEDEGETLPYISNEHIESWTGKLLIESAEPSESDGRKFSKDDVLFNKLRPYLAKVYQAEFDGISSGELLCLTPSSRLHSRFLFYVTSSKLFVDAVNLETFGSKMPRADWEIVGHQPLPLPPIETQEKIAAFLDEKTAQIDGLIEKKRALLERLAEKRQALITQAVTKGLNPNAPIKDSGVDWLGQVPAHWVLRPLWAICKITTGYAFDSNDFEPEGVPVVRISDVKPSGKVDVGNSKCIDKEASEKFLRYMVGSGDILMAMTGATVGKAAIYGLEESALLNQRVAAFRAIEQLSQSFLWFLMNSSSYLDYVTLTSYGGAQPNISDKQLLDFRVALPGATEQTEIASFLGHECTKIDTAYQNVLISVSTLEEYRATLISSAVTGKLDGLQ